MKNLFLLIACPFCFSGLVLAQEKQDSDKGIFRSREHYFEFMGRIDALNDPELNAMIPAMNDVIMASHNLKQAPFGSPFHSSKSWMLRILDNDGVRKEIEMVDYQYDELKQSSHEIAERMTEVTRKLVYQSQPLNAKQIKKQFAEIRESAEAKIEQLILPEQQSRLKQLLVHGRLIRENLIDVVTKSPVAEELELDAGQKKELRKHWREIEAKLAVDIAKLKANARKELARHMQPEQRRKYQKLFGDDFEFKQNKSKSKTDED